MYFSRARLLPLVLAATLATGAPACLAAADPKASRFYEDALARYERKDIAGAILQLKNALQIDRSMLSAQLLLGRALLADGDAGGAEVAFNESLRLGVSRAEVALPLARALVAQGKHRQVLEHPRFAPAGLPTHLQVRLLLLRASAYTELGDARAAMKSVDDARALEPASAAPWLSEVPIRIRARQLREALAAADRAVQLAPTLPEAHYQRGTVLHAMGDAGGALAAYDRALAADPGHDEALVSRAGLLIDLARPADARRDVDALRKLAPKDPRGAYLRALLLEQSGDAAGSRAALAEVTALLDPVPIDHYRYRPQVLMLGGLAHFGLDEKEKARPYLEAVVRGQPGNPAAKLLARIQLAAGSFDSAIETLEPYLKAQPGDSQAQLLLASAHFAQNRHARAAQLMDDALKTADRPELRAMLGLSLVGSGKIADAVRELENAFRKDPGQLQAGMALGLVYLESGLPDRAAAVAARLVQVHGSNPGVHHLHGAALARKGDSEAAHAAFERALKLQPGFVQPQVGLARLDVQAGRLDAAQTRLAELLKTDDKNLEVLAESAALAERRQRAPEAQRLFEKAADHAAPGNLAPRLALVDFHLRQGRPDSAREAVRRLTAAAPEAMPVLLATARVALANGDAETARGDLLRASRLAGFDAAVLMRVAELQSAAGAPADAMHSLDKALKERPDFLAAMALMAELELRQGAPEKAELRARQIVARFPRSGVGPSLLGDVALARGQSGAAVEQFRRAHALEAGTASLLRLHRALVQADPPAATSLADQWLKKYPQDLAVRRAHADALARAGQLAAARTQYEALLQAAPDDPEVLNNLANVLLLAADPGALAVAERALAKAPGRPHVLGTAGWAAFKAGQTDRALQLLRDARLRDPSNPETRYFLGAVLASTGRSAEAREELQGALRSGRSFGAARDAERLLASLGP